MNEQIVIFPSNCGMHETCVSCGKDFESYTGPWPMGRDGACCDECVDRMPSVRAEWKRVCALERDDREAYERWADETHAKGRDWLAPIDVLFAVVEVEEPEGGWAF